MLSMLLRRILPTVKLDELQLGSWSAGASATGADATAASATGASAVGALALGVAALGGAAVGFWTADRMRIAHLRVDDLDVRRLRIGGREVTVDDLPGAEKNRRDHEGPAG